MAPDPIAEAGAEVDNGLLWRESELEHGLNGFLLGIGIIKPESETRDVGADAGRMDPFASIENRFDLRVQDICLPSHELRSLLASHMPFAIGVGVGEDKQFVLVGRGSGRGVRVYARTHCLVRISFADLLALVGTEASRRRRPEALPSGLRELPSAMQRKLFDVLARDDSPHVYEDVRVFHPGPEAPFRQQVRHRRLHKYLVLLVGSHLARYLLLIASWWVLGSVVLGGSFDEGWLLAWSLLLISQVPLLMATEWSEGKLSIGLGALVKQSMLQAITHTRPSRVPAHGVSEALGRTVDAEAVEDAAINGSLMILLAVVEMMLALAVLSQGVAGARFVVLYVGFLTVAALLLYQHYTIKRAWTLVRIKLTRFLTDALIGHRTTLVQAPRKASSEAECTRLAQYDVVARKSDGISAVLEGAAARVWLLVALLALLPAIGAGEASLESVAISVGGILLGFQALQKGLSGSDSLLISAIALQNLKPIWKAQETRKRQGIAKPPEQGASDRAVLEAHALTFCHPSRAVNALNGCSMSLYTGDRVLLQGPSGAGKSTLIDALTGMLDPDAGLILHRGYDIEALGEKAWRRAFVAVPQSHDNHVFAGTLAFNALMGRKWPPSLGDLDEAERILRELGLGDLLGRMPAGLMQFVGDSGWQLSHGEKSRVFIARALLQPHEVLIFDESLAALDPETFELALRCLERRSKSLVLVAHT